MELRRSTDGATRARAVAPEVRSAAMALGLLAAGLLPVGCASSRKSSAPDARKVATARVVEEGAAPASSAPESLPSAASQPSETALAQDPSGPAASAPASLPSKERNPYSRFGPQVVVQPDGKLTKFFSVRASKGKTIGEFLVRYGSLVAGQVEVVPGADTQDARVLPFQQPAPPTAVPVSDWVVVTGVWEDLERAERLLNVYFASVPQIEIEARIAEVTTSDVTDIGVRSTDPKKPSFQSGKHNFISAFDPKFPNASAASEGLLSLTAVQSPIQFQATLELLAARRDVDIISTPRIAVRNGGRAEIVNGNEIPYAEITTVVGGVPTSTIRYKQTGVKLFVTPYLAGQDTVLLNLEVESSIPTNVTETSTASVNPIVATRSAKTDVHIRDGNTFVIGGLISTNNLEQVQKVPLLGDIPILGLLFRSTLTQKTSTEVLFFITPRVIREPSGFDFVVPNPD